MNSLCRRESGVLLHLASFPDRSDFIGTPGPDAWELLKRLSRARIKWLQLLPLGPIGSGHSPYSSCSAFALEPLFLNVELLYQRGFLAQADWEDYQNQVIANERIDYTRLYDLKASLLEKSWEFYEKTKNSATASAALDHFKNQSAEWLHDYALFMSLKEQFPNDPWSQWPDPYRFYNAAIELNDQYTNRYEFHCYLQWLINDQWLEFLAKAKQYNIKIMGDCPIFVSYDSAEVWSHPELFILNENRECEYVAGVPPDYFSPTGQKWGNPLYDWGVHKKNHYAWWKSRLQRLGQLCDCIRIDHFRGFDQYWSIEASQPDARSGQWQDGPGLDFFESLQNQAGIPQIIAEDLGDISDSVRSLLKQSGLAGMRIFAFAPWDSGKFEKDGQLVSILEHEYIPQNWSWNSIGYPGTHDNDTFRGWYKSLSLNAKKILMYYLNDDFPKSIEKNGDDENYKDNIDLFLEREMESPESAPFWEALAIMLKSDSQLVIVPMQDFLELGSTARMNTPGTSNDLNWSWRLHDPQQLDAPLQKKIRDLIELSNR